MTRSKLGFHIQKPEYPDWLKNDVARSGCEWVKIINPDAGAPQPFSGIVKYIGRLYFGRGEPDKELIWQGGAGADAWWAMAESRIRACPWVNVWEGPNEPAIDSEERAYLFVEFELRRNEILHNLGLQVASGVFSTGCPYLSLWSILGYGLTHSNYLVLHQYGMRTMSLTKPENDWHLLRHLKVIRALEDAGHRIPPIMITETGIDYGGNPETDGWRAQGFTPSHYRDQLANFDNILQQSPHVVVATPFTWLHDGWPSFNIDSHMSALLADYMEFLNDAPTPEMLIGQDAQDWIVPLNPEAAFEREASMLGYLPAMPERDIIISGITYRYQAFRHPDEREWQHLAYCVVGDWGNVRWFRRRN